MCDILIYSGKLLYTTVSLLLCYLSVSHWSRFRLRIFKMSLVAFSQTNLLKILILPTLAKKLNDPCTEDADCSVAYSECKNRKCTCIDGFPQENRICKTTSWSFSFCMHYCSQVSFQSAAVPSAITQLPLTVK